MGGCANVYILDIQCFSIVKSRFLPVFAAERRFLCVFEGVQEVLQGGFSGVVNFFSLRIVLIYR